MAFRSIGGSRIIGSGTPQSTPISLDPAPYLGALVYGDDGRVYVSDGTQWLDVGSGTQGNPGIQGAQGVQGLQGDYGPGFTILGSVADVDAGGDPQATLNTGFPGANIGEGVIDEADDELWIYNGTNWVNIGSFRGVQGFTGAQGTQGVQGDIGEEGIQGSRGFRGFQGFQGMQGLQGVQGDFGIQGIQGLQGTQGPQGVQGVQGLQGLQGLQGVQGPQAAQGVQGVQGDFGIQGWQGSDAGLTLTFNLRGFITEANPTTGGVVFNGAAANTDNFTAVTKLWIDDADNHNIDVQGLYQAMDNSSSANKGYVKFTRRDEPAMFVIFSVQELTEKTDYWEFDVTYISGAATKEDFAYISTPPSTYTSYELVTAFDIAGDRGFQGIQGPQAFQGVQGVQGVQGLQGLQGWQGTQGVQGYEGFQGAQGTQGTQGVQGSQGTQGTQGVQGSQGTQGFQGVQGTQGMQGWQGTQGAQGTQGMQGWQGTQGFQGFQGFQGAQGTMGYHGGLTYEWNFSSTISSFPQNPGTNNWLLNNADITLATQLIIDDIPVDNYTNQVDEVFDWLAAIPGGSGSKGLIIVESYDDGNGPGGHHQVVYEFTDFTWDSGAKTYGYFTVQYVGQYGLPNDNWDTDVIGTGHGRKTLINFVPRGEAGTQGAQGTQGFQGYQGVQGTQGTQGAQGAQGTQGTQGAQGTAGSYGGSSFEYDYTPVTDPTGPASGLLKFNNADITAASILRISQTDTNGSDLENFYNSLDDNSSATKAYIKITSIADPAEFAIYGMTALTDAGAYFNMTVSFLSKSANMDATYLTNNTDIIVSYTTSGDAGVQGAQGAQGTQGVQGVQGLQGWDGFGDQGVQGVQGDLGFQGVQGYPGFIGPQGVQGTQGFQGAGFQGATGGFGGVTFDYTYSTNTGATDPGVGFLKFNNTPASATKMFMDDRDDNFVDIQPFLRTIDDSTSPIKGHVKVSSKLTPYEFVLFTINSLTEASGYFDIDVAYVSGSVSNFVDATDIIVTFARTGDVGPPGSQGVQGYEGFQGFQGAPGNIGFQGTQGMQGTQGFQGFQGAPGFVGGDGTQGSQGVQGVQGVQGIAGSDGSAGFQGLQGTQGFQGFDGGEGAQGTQGFQGVAGTGATGVQGFQGFQGEALQGVQGFQGNEGPAGTGVQGTQGFQGFEGGPGGPGPQGFQGTPGEGNQGTQGFQGFEGGVGAQGFQGNNGSGSQGTQGFQGAAGIGDTGVQGFKGAQGLQGFDGNIGEGGAQGPQGVQGFQGFQGNDGSLGSPGPQGFQGAPGDIGIQGGEGVGSQGIQGLQGVQGDLGVQGFPGAGNQGVQGPQGTYGIQGYIGFQGTQGVQGPGIVGQIPNIQAVYESTFQDTPMFIGMVVGGSTESNLYTTSGPNPGGESNFFYTADVDELTVENLQVEGNINVVGTLNAATITGNSSSIHMPSDTAMTFGGPEGAAYVEQFFETSSTTLVFDANTSIVTNISFRDMAAGVDEFTFNLQTGEFTAAGDISSNSDERLKENIETIDNALEKVSKLRGVYFDLKSNPGVRKTGVIAQEVEAVLPEAVKTDPDGEQIKSVAYASMVGLLIEAVKDLKEEVDQIRIDNIKSQ